MSKRNTRRVADDITAGMKAIEQMIASGKRPAELFTSRTIEIPDPSERGCHGLCAVWHHRNTTREDCH